MAGGERRRRDTLAFVLTILGASLWSMWPAGALFRGEGIGPEVGLPVVFGVGALVGAWSGTTLWRHVSWVLPAAVAAALAAMMLQLRYEAMHGAYGLHATEVVGVAAAAVGGALGTLLGWRARVARRTLVAAWITISGPGVLMLGVAVARGLGYEPDANPWAWIAMLSIVPAAAVAARLCGSVRPERFFSTLFGLLVVIFVVSLASDRNEARTQVSAFFGLVLLAGILAGLATVPIARWHRRHPAPDDLPAAQLVER